METSVHPTDLLRADHRNVLDKLSNLEYIIDILDQPDTAVSRLRDLGAFFKTGLWAHIWKEEDAFFPAIKQPALRKKDPIGQMLIEHKDLRKADERFQRDVAGYLRDPGNDGAVALIQKSGTRIVKLLRDHFHKEDSALFGIADMYLNRAQERQILNLFGTIEADIAWGFENLEEFYP